MKTLLIYVFAALLIGIPTFKTWMQPDDDLSIVSPENITQLAPLARLGHGSARYLDWHPDGQIIAFGGGWGIWLLDENFTEVAHFTDVPRIQDLAWHPSENLLATLHEAEIRVWRITDDFSSVMLDHSFSVTAAHRWYGVSLLDRCLMWSSNGSVIAVGTPPLRERIADEDPIPAKLRLLEFYNSTNGDLLNLSIPKLERQVSARCRYGTVSPDGQLETYLRYGYNTGFHYVDFVITPNLDAESIAEFPRGLSEVYAMDWHPSGDYITVIHQFALQNMTWPDLTRSDHTFFNGFISSLEWSPDGKMLLAGSEHTAAGYLWSQQDGSTEFEEISLTWSGDGMDYGGLSWSPTGDLHSCTAEYAYWRCDIIDIETQKIVRRVTQSENPYQMAIAERYHMTWNADFTRYALIDREISKIIVASFTDVPVSVTWNIDIGRYVVGDYSPEDGKPLPEIQLPGSFEQFLGMYWEDEKLYINLGEDYAHQTLYKWDEAVNQLIEIEDAPRRNIWRPLQIDRHTVADPRYETRDQYDLSVLDSDTGEALSLISDLPVPETAFVQAVHPSRRFAALNARGGIQFWSLEDGSLLHTVSTERDIAALVWDAEGRRLAAGSMDGTVYIFGIP